MSEPPQKPVGLKILPWVWIGLGALFCFLLGAFIKDLAQANGPGTGGALLLLPLAAAAYPVGLFWIGVGLTLLFEHRWSPALAFVSSAGLLLISGALLVLPPLIPVSAALASLAIATFALLLSPKTRDYRQAAEAVRNAKIERIRQGLETPVAVSWLMWSWTAGGLLFLFSWPLSALYFHFFPASEDVNREFAYLVGFLSIPFGAIMLWIGRKFRTARKGTVTAARLLLIFGWLGLIVDALAFPSVVVISTIFFFYLTSWIALGQAAFKAYLSRV